MSLIWVSFTWPRDDLFTTVYTVINKWNVGWTTCYRSYCAELCFAYLSVNVDQSALRFACLRYKNTHPPPSITASRQPVIKNNHHKKSTTIKMIFFVWVPLGVSSYTSVWVYVCLSLCTIQIHKRARAHITVKKITTTTVHGFLKTRLYLKVGMDFIRLVSRPFTSASTFHWEHSYV